MPRPHLVLAAAALAALAVSGCSQPTPANDNTNSQQTDRTITPPTVLRTPVRVPEAEATVPLPGPTGGPQGEDPEVRTTFSPGPDGEGVQAENDGG